MLTRFFHSGFATQYTVIFITGLLLWARAFFFPPEMPTPEGTVPLWSLTYLLLSELPRLAVILGFLLTLASAFILNDLLTRNAIILKNSSFGAFAYVIMASYFPAFLVLNPVNISIFFLIMILRTLMGAYSRNELLDLTYTAGFLTAAGSFFYQPFIFFTILLFVALILFRSSNWRDYASTIIGLLTPFIFLVVYYFWFDKLETKVMVYIHSFGIRFTFEYVKGTVYFILTALMLLVMITGWISGFGKFSEKTIEIRSKAYLVTWIFFISLAAAPFANINLSFHFLFMIIPLTSVFTAYMLRLRKPRWQEIGFLVFLVFVVIHNSLYIYF